MKEILEANIIMQNILEEDIIKPPRYDDFDKMFKESWDDVGTKSEPLKDIEEHIDKIGKDIVKEVENLNNEQLTS